MRVMKEFGYQVSKDYEKLKNIFICSKSFISVFGFSDGKSAVIQNIEDNGNVNMYIAHRPTRIEYCSFPYDKIIRYCKKYNLAFIDPEPSNPNAIFYADGSEVEVGDVIETNGNERAIITNPHQGSWEASGDREYSEPICNFENIKWDGNRMTNVEKVEK